MNKNPIAAVWLVGAAAALGIYLLGSDWLLLTLTGLAEALSVLLDDLVRQLSMLTAGLLRALAVGLFVTFIGLCLLAVRAGHRGRLALVVVSAGFFWLVGSGYVSRADWVLALVLAACGAVVMTMRLMQGTPSVARSGM